LLLLFLIEKAGLMMTLRGSKIQSILLRIASCNQCFLSICYECHILLEILVCRLHILHAWITS
jgi:hypothetical protein